MDTPFGNYVKRTADIRKLSSPVLDSIENAEKYSNVLYHNFETIGELAVDNRSLLDEILYPLLNSEAPLDKEKIEELETFAEQLADAYNMENLDVPMLLLVTERLLRDALSGRDVDYMIQQMDAEISSCYTMINIGKRLWPVCEIDQVYRKRGLETADMLLEFLEKDKFRRITSAASRESILINSRYASALYEGLKNNAEANLKNMAILERALLLEKDEEMKQLAPEYDWRYHHLRTLQYFGLLTESANEIGLDETQLERCCTCARELYDLWRSDEAYYEQFMKETELDLIFARNYYLTGRLEKSVYIEQLKQIYNKRDEVDYTVDGIFQNLLLPVEILIFFENEPFMSEKDKAFIESCYRNIVNYAFQMPKGGSLIYMLEFLSKIINHFIEIPGCMSFEDFGLSCFAALHPPTYNHSVMVAQLTRCLCEHLLRLRPELFIGTMDTQNRREVLEKKDQLVSFAYHAGLCHDFGKMPMIDTIMTYGRSILELEFDIIKQHPAMGAWMLSRYESTKRYADVAKGHHKWYDNTAGYPPEFDITESDSYIFIQLIACADCMDAATDAVGRSYQKGKSLDVFLDEIRAQSGTRYAPYLVALLEREEVRYDMEYLLREGRNNNYQNTYMLLKDLQERGTTQNNLQPVSVRW